MSVLTNQQLKRKTHPDDETRGNINFGFKETESEEKGKGEVKINLGNGAVHYNGEIVDIKNISNGKVHEACQGGARLHDVQLTDKGLPLKVVFCNYGDGS